MIIINEGSGAAEGYLSASGAAADQRGPGRGHGGRLPAGPVPPRLPHADTGQGRHYQDQVFYVSMSDEICSDYNENTLLKNAFKNAFKNPSKNT